MELRKLTNRLGRLFPLSSCEIWDHSGYQLGDKTKSRDIKKVFLCLDLTEALLPVLQKERPGLILTHHPFFFGKPKDIRLSDSRKDEFSNILQSEFTTAIYSYHTNFDASENGMNDTLLEILGFSRIGVGPDGIMRFATLPSPMKVHELALYMKNRLNLKYAFYHEASENTIEIIALIAGGGSGFYMDAINLGAECYISGDCPHHTRVDMKRYHVNYIDLSHEIEEQGFLIGMEKALKNIGFDGDVISYSYEEDFSIVC